MRQGKVERGVFASPEEVAEKAADLLVEAANQATSMGRPCSLALSGGSTPRVMHRLLVQDPYCRRIPWKDLHLFWVDERWVDPQDPESNYGNARRDFLNSAPISPEQVHPMPTQGLPAEAALQYEEHLKGFFQLGNGQFPNFDLIFLGVGVDGHVASLFPTDHSLEEENRLVISVRGGIPLMDRLTLTLPVLNRGRRVVLIITGKDKAGVVAALWGTDPPDLPAARLTPLQGRITWLLDRAASSRLDHL